VQCASIAKRYGKVGQKLVACYFCLELTQAVQRAEFDMLHIFDIRGHIKGKRRTTLVGAILGWSHRPCGQDREGVGKHVATIWVEQGGNEGIRIGMECMERFEMLSQTIRLEIRGVSLLGCGANDGGNITVPSVWVGDSGRQRNG